MRTVSKGILTGAFCAVTLLMLSLSGFVLPIGLLPGAALSAAALLLMVKYLPVFRGSEAVWAGALGPFAVGAADLLWLQRLMWANGTYDVPAVDLTMLLILFLLALGPQEILLIAAASRICGRPRSGAARKRISQKTEDFVRQIPPECISDTEDSMRE